jgi:hypothetical protein
MNQEFHDKVLQLAAETRRLISQMEEYIKDSRQNLNVESAFEMSNYATPEGRENSSRILNEYIKLLVIEKTSYEQYNSRCSQKLSTLLDEISADERNKFTAIVAPKLSANLQLQMNINTEKTLATKKSLELIETFRNIHNPDTSVEIKIVNGPIWLNKIEELDSEISEHLNKQYDLAMQQRKNHDASEKNMKSLLELLNSIQN